MEYYSEITVFIATFFVFVVFKIGSDLLESIIADKPEPMQRNIRLQVLVFTIIVSLILFILYCYCAGYGLPTKDTIEELLPVIFC